MTLILAVFGALLPPTSASAQTTFDNKPDLQNAADLWCSNETAALAAYGNIADWDVSRITDMSCLFSAYCGGSATGKSTCNPDIGSWDTSAVLDMSSMFDGASSFDKDISSWNTSAVLSMHGMFATAGASSFDKDLSSWDVSAALSMDYMFYGATSLSDCNKALMHASFVAQTSAWPYSWGSQGCPTGGCGDGTVLDAVTRKCEVSLGNGTEVLDGKCEVVLGSATEVIDGKCELIGLGDFDGDGAFRLADAVFVARVWTGTAQWPVAGGRRDRRSLTSDGVDLLALLERQDAELERQDAELERKDAELTELRAKLAAKKFKE